MKNMRKLFALALTVVMVLSLSTVAFAASAVSRDIEYTINIKDATINTDATTFTAEVVVNASNGDDVEIAKNAASNIDVTLFYDSSVFTFVNATSEVASVDAAEDYTSEEGPLVIKLVCNTSNLTLTPNTVVCSIEFSVNAAEGVYEFTNDVGGMVISDGATGIMVEPVEKVSTVTIKAAAQDPVITGTPTRESFTVGDKKYTNVWVGAYDIALNGNTVTNAVVSFITEGKTFRVAPNVDGQGSASFKIAIVGVPTTVAAPTVTIE